MLKKVVKSPLFTSIVLIILAFILTITAFYPNRPYLSWDGVFHMSRFTQIAESLRHFQLPAMVSFIGGNNNMNAMTSMYPWMSNLFIIVPMIFFRPVMAITIGIFLINIVAAFNSYVMMKYFTKNKMYRFLGVTLYLYNTYHLIDLYAKFDFGEVAAYAFLPLIVVGLFYTWDNEKKGIIALSFGIIGIANAHLLSFFFTTGIIIFIEFYRIIRRKFTIKELKSFIISALISSLGSLYSLSQIVYISMHNSLFTPPKGWNQVSLMESFNDLISNQFHEFFSTWNLGIVMSAILMFLTVKLFFSEGSIRSWNRYTAMILGLMLLIYNVLPLERIMTKSVMGLLQYTGRLFILVVILGIIAFTKYCNSIHIGSMRVLVLMTLTVIAACGSISIYSNKKYDNSRRGVYPLTSKDFNNVINTKTGLMDYVPTEMYKNKNKASNNIKIHKITGNYKEAEYKVIANKSGEEKLPLAYINGVGYSVNVNHRNEKLNNKHGQIAVYLQQGNNLVNISSMTSSIWYAIFGISIATIFSLVIYSLWKLWWIL